MAITAGADRLTTIIAVSSAVTALTALVALILAWRIVKPADYVDISKVDHACQGDRVAAECMLTNKTADPIKTCFLVRLRNKQNPEETVTSITMCPGRLDNYESRTVRAPWYKDVDKACHDSVGALDFRACTFEIEPASSH